MKYMKSDRPEMWETEEHMFMQWSPYEDWMFAKEECAPVYAEFLVAERTEDRSEVIGKTSSDILMERRIGGYPDPQKYGKAADDNIRLARYHRMFSWSIHAANGLMNKHRTRVLDETKPVPVPENVAIASAYWFRVRNERWPTDEDLSERGDMPDPGEIHSVFGSMDAYIKTCEAVGEYVD